MAHWFERIVGAINREYERRIRRASQVGEYNTHQGHAEASHDEDEGAVEIVNVPRGTAVFAPPRNNHSDEQ